MSALATPLDALIFPVVINNIWAWVAVITAAVSFWWIRVVGPPVGSKSENPDKSPQLTVLPPPTHTEEEEEEAVSTSASSTTTALTRETTTVAADVDTTGGRKFTVYYEDEREEGEVDDGGDGGFGEVGRGGRGDDYWWDNWEKVMRMRIGGGDMGWYRYQDLTVLDGNVVRLWDEYCRDKSTITLSSGVIML